MDILWTTFAKSVLHGPVQGLFGGIFTSDLHMKGEFLEGAESSPRDLEQGPVCDVLSWEDLDAS